MKIIGIAMSLCFCVGSAGAQSLGEVAKKERERREANAEAGKTAVVIAEGTGELEVEEMEGESAAPETATTDEESRAAELERKLEEANEKLDELIARTPEPQTPPKEEKPRLPTARERADGFAQRMSELRESYPQLIARCQGGALATVENDLIVAIGDSVACDDAEAMRKEYDALYRKIWAIEGASILKRNLPKKLDPNRA